MKGAGMLVVSLRSLRGVNFRFWSRLRCSGQNTIIFSPLTLIGLLEEILKNYIFSTRFIHSIHVIQV